MELFYTSQVLYPHFYLHNEDAVHCIKSLRKNIRDEIFATDGNGHLYHGQITHIDTKKYLVTAHILHHENKIKPHNLGICVAPTKNADRMEWLVEKATELGISHIQWIITQHSQRKNIAIERMQRIAIAAMKQSLQYFLPSIHQICTFSDWLQKQETLHGIIGYCGETEKKPLYSIQKFIYTDIFWLCIGPEGDFTENEVKQATEKGLIPVSIGTNRLRTETAALTAMAYFYINS